MDNKKLPLPLLITGIDFLKEIISYYGEERGTELWKSMRDSMGPEIQNAIMIAMLKGNNLLGTVTISAAVPYEQQKCVLAINEIRRITGMSLKEAKDFIDIARFAPHKLKLPEYRNITEFSQNMLDAGFKVS